MNYPIYKRAIHLEKKIADLYFLGPVVLLSSNIAEDVLHIEFQIGSLLLLAIREN